MINKFYRHLFCLLVGLCNAFSMGAQPKQPIREPVKTNVDINVPINGKLRPGNRYQGGFVATITGKESDKLLAIIVAPQDVPGQYNWTDARKACEDFVHDGFDDWALPYDVEQAHFRGMGRDGTIPGLRDKQIWTATEHGTSSAKYYDYVGGTLQHGNRSLLMTAGCIRRAPYREP
jgi:hypothetical protein